MVSSPADVRHSSPPVRSKYNMHEGAERRSFRDFREILQIQMMQSVPAEIINFESDVGMTL